MICRFDSSTDNINDGMTGGPLAIFNKAGKTVVISPYNNFMASSAWHINKPGGHVCWGIMGGVNEVPANFSFSTLLVYDDGINQVCVCFSYSSFLSYTVFLGGFLCAYFL